MAKEWQKPHGVLVKTQVKLEIMNSWGPASLVLCFFSPASYQCRHSEGQVEVGGGKWEVGRGQGVQYHRMSPEWVRDQGVYCIHHEAESRLGWGSGRDPQGSPSCS